MPYFLWEFDPGTRRKGVFGAAGTEAGPVGGSGHPTPVVRQRRICLPDEEGHPTRSDAVPHGEASPRSGIDTRPDAG